MPSKFHRSSWKRALRSISPPRCANCLARMGSTSKFNSKKLNDDEKSAAGGAWLATVESQTSRQLRRSETGRRPTSRGRASKIMCRASPRPCHPGSPSSGGCAAFWCDALRRCGVAFFLLDTACACKYRWLLALEQGSALCLRVFSCLWCTARRASRLPRTAGASVPVKGVA